MPELKPVLIVEDDENDITILRAALADLNVANPVRAVRSGKEAILYLMGTGERGDPAVGSCPGLMLLDLQLPGMSGFAILRWLGRHPELKADWQVAVMTSFAWPGTPQMVKRLGAEDFFEKPIGYGQLKERLRGVLSRWQDQDRSRDYPERAA